MSLLQRYGAIYWMMIRNSLIRELSFKANFLLWIVVEVFWFVGQFAFVEVMFQFVDRIGDWTKWEVVALIGTHQLIGQIFQAFFYVNLSNLPELIRTGRLDIMLLLPVDAQFAVSTRQFGMDNIVSATVGAGFVSLALVKLSVVPGLLQIALYLAAVALGVAIHYAVLFSLATMAFWIVRAQGIVYGYFNLFNIGRYPADVFRGPFKRIFSTVIPVILVANVPARLLVRAWENPFPALGRLLAATAFTLLASRLFWLHALRRYSSASS